MANNAFNFKGLYDKIAGLLKNSAIVEPGEYNPNQNDYVAVYKNVPGSPGSGDSTIAIKEYVSVTDIGTGGGGGGGGSMSSFQVTGEGGVTLSLDGTIYDDGPITIENDDNLRISATTVPAGLNWEGQWSNAFNYQLNDVVSNVAGGVYTTWFYINQTPSTGNPLPAFPATSNTWWAQLGTQGPPGATGPTGLPSSTATFGFTPFTAAGGTHTGVINVSGLPGSTSNTTGKIIKVNNTSTTTELVVVVNANNNQQGWPLNSQITFVNISNEANAPVKIVGATTPSAPANVTLNSADNAQYLRTTNSTCSIVREAENIYWMFGDLTNIS